MADYYGAGIKSVRNSLNSVLKPIIANPKTSFIYTLISNWDRIFGSKYSNYCALGKVFLLNDGKQGNIIIYSYNSVTSFYLSNRNRFILDNINSLFGYQAVLKISIKEIPKVALDQKL